jgi:hypothetical protein
VGAQLGQASDDQCRRAGEAALGAGDPQEARAAARAVLDED